jgi:hypothetical protein
VSLVSGLGCEADRCAEDGSPCGGDLTGTWRISDACRDPAFAAPVQATYQSQPVAMARQPVPETTSSDWCSSVVIGAQGLTTFVFPHDTLSVKMAQLSYAADGTYQARIDTTGRGGIELSASCLTRFGVSVGCDAVAASLADFAAQMRTTPGFHCSDSPSEPAGCLFYYSYQNIGCAPDGNSGCACAYDVSFAGTFNGRWSAAGGRVIHFDDSKMLPSQADYCVGGTGDALSLWGHDRTSLFDEPGLRTLKFQRMP